MRQDGADIGSGEERGDSLEIMREEAMQLLEIEQESTFPQVRELIRPYIDFKEEEDSSLYLPENAAFQYKDLRIHFLLDFGRQFHTSRNMPVTKEMVKRWNLINENVLLIEGCSNIRKENPMKVVLLEEKGNASVYSVYLDIDYGTETGFAPYSYGLSFLLIPEYMDQLRRRFGHFAIFPASSQFALLLEGTEKEDKRIHYRGRDLLLSYLVHADKEFVPHHFYF